VGSFSIFHWLILGLPVIALALLIFIVLAVMQLSRRRNRK